MFHDDPRESAHLGEAKTLKQIEEHFYWPGMMTSVQQSREHLPGVPAGQEAQGEARPGCSSQSRQPRSWRRSPWTYSTHRRPRRTGTAT